MLSTSTVSRGVVLLERDACGEWHSIAQQVDIALARCPQCGTRSRVLPYDILPYKQYSLAVITELVISYATWQHSLRDVVWDLLGERTPSHTTLHGWTEGLGAHVLGLPGAEASGLPFSRFVVEAQARVTSVTEVVEAQFLVDERRYCSEERRERLSGVAMLMAVVGMVAGELDAIALAQCRRLALVWSNSCVLIFYSRFLCTPIEHMDESDLSESWHPQPQSRDSCPTRTRSPPGASNKSHH